MSCTTRAVLKIVLLGILVVGGWGWTWSYEQQHGPGELHDANENAARLNADADVLRQVAQQLESRSRVADVLVISQSETDGVPHATLLFQEHAKDGTSLEPRRFIIEGKTAQIQSLVLHFQGPYVEKYSPLRGASLALFTRIFGNKETAEHAQFIDEPGHISAIYRGADPKVSEFERDLWRDFWRLANNEVYARQQGADIARGQGVLGPLETGQIYTVTLQTDAGINVTCEPLKRGYVEMLKHDEQKLSGAP